MAPIPGSSSWEARGGPTSLILLVLVEKTPKTSRKMRGAHTVTGSAKEAITGSEAQVGHWVLRGAPGARSSCSRARGDPRTLGRALDVIALVAGATGICVVHLVVCCHSVVFVRGVTLGCITMGVCHVTSVSHVTRAVAGGRGRCC